MTCEPMIDPTTGKPIGILCSRGRGESEPLKQRFGCRRRLGCKQCQDHASCKEIAQKLKRRDEGGAS